MATKPITILREVTDLHGRPLYCGVTERITRGYYRVSFGEHHGYSMIYYGKRGGWHGDKQLTETGWYVSHHPSSGGPATSFGGIWPTLREAFEEAVADHEIPLDFPEPWDPRD